MGAPKGSQNAKGNKGGGRPTLYREEYNKKAYKLALLGLIDKEIADIFDVTRETINAWKRDHPKFKEMLNKGKVMADAEVSHSLFKRATGYKHKETKVFCSEGVIVTKEVTRKYAPCPVSAKFWLNNRQPDKWRDKREEEPENPQDNKITEIRKTVIYRPKNDA